MLQLVAEHPLGAVEVVLARLAIEELAGDVPAVVVRQGAVGRYAAVVAPVGIVLQVALQGQGGVVAEVDGQGRGDGVALLLDVIELGVRALAETDQAVGDALLLVERPAEIEAHLLLAHVADAAGDLAVVLVQRLLAGQRHQAARQATAVEHRGRPLEHIDAFEEVRVDLHRAEGTAVAHGLEAVEVDVVHAVVGEAAHHHVVVAVGGADLAGEDAGGIAHRLLHGLGGGVVDLLAGDHRDGLAGFQQRLAGLGGDLAMGGQVAIGAAQVVAEGEDLHRLHVQHIAVLCRRLAQDEAAVALVFRFQRGVGEQPGQALLHGETAAQPLGAVATGLRRSGREGDAGFAGEAVEHVAQLSGGDRIGPRLFRRRFGGRGAERRRAGRHGQRQQGRAHRTAQARGAGEIEGRRGIAEDDGGGGHERDPLESLKGVQSVKPDQSRKADKNNENNLQCVSLRTKASVHAAAGATQAATTLTHQRVCRCRRTGRVRASTCSSLSVSSRR